MFFVFRENGRKPPRRSDRRHPAPRGLALGLVMLWVLVMGGVDVEVPFIYFQF